MDRWSRRMGASGVESGPNDFEFWIDFLIYASGSAGWQPCGSPTGPNGMLLLGGFRMRCRLEHFAAIGCLVAPGSMVAQRGIPVRTLSPPLATSVVTFGGILAVRQTASGGVIV